MGKVMRNGSIEPAKPLAVEQSRTFGYCRVSNLDSAKSGLSFEAQELQIRNYIKYKELPSITEPFFTDRGVSGGTPLAERPAGRKAQNALRRGDHIVFAKLDRAFRNLDDCRKMMALWKSMGVTVHILDLQVDTSLPTGELMLNLLAAFAHFNRQVIAERIREAKERNRANGQPTSQSIAYGYIWIKNTRKSATTKWIMCEDLYCRRALEWITVWHNEGVSHADILIRLRKQKFFHLYKRRHPVTGEHVYIEREFSQKQDSPLWLNIYLKAQRKYAESHPNLYRDTPTPHDKYVQGQMRNVETGELFRVDYLRMTHGGLLGRDHFTGRSRRTKEQIMRDAAGNDG